MYKVAVTVRMTKGQKKAFAQKVKSLSGISQSEVIRALVQQWVDGKIKIEI